MQAKKASSQIDVTELGIIVLLHPLISSFVSVSISALQLFLESYFGFPFSTVIIVNPLQPLKALLLIYVTDFGILTEIKFDNPSQRYDGILSTSSPKTKDMIFGVFTKGG